jgi:hypothetical protein
MISYHFLTLEERIDFSIISSIMRGGLIDLISSPRKGRISLPRLLPLEGGGLRWGWGNLIQIYPKGKHFMDFWNNAIMENCNTGFFLVFELVLLAENQIVIFWYYFLKAAIIINEYK